MPRLRSQFMITLLCVLALPGCGKLGEKFGRLSGGDNTTVTIHTAPSGPHAQIVLTGMMVYAERSDNPMSRGSRFISGAGTSLQWTLPTGKYRFYAFGYTAAGFSGNLHCARTGDILLDGSPRDITLVADDNGICGQPPFSPTPAHAASADTIKNLYIGTCDNSTGNIFLAYDTTPNVCDGSGGRPGPGSPPLTDISIDFLEFDAFNGPPQIGPGGLSSGCIAGSYGGTPTTTSRAVPFGHPFLVKLKFWTSSCTTGAYFYQLNRGFEFASQNQFTRAFNGSSTDVTGFMSGMTNSNPTAAGNVVFFRSP